MITIRSANVYDAPYILDIYRYYVEKTAITFEYEVPSVEEFTHRIEHTLTKYPYIVAEEKGKIIGYAYAETFKARAAYDWSVETTIYLDHTRKHGGLGKRLYTALEAILVKQGICNANACITSPEVEDEYCDHNSEGYHEHLGYKLVGKFHRCGYKFDTWYNMVWMEKFINDHTVPSKKITWYPELVKTINFDEF